MAWKFLQLFWSILYTERMSIASFAQKAIPVFKAQGVTKAAIFGSFARGDAKKNSDVDFLVRFRGEKGLLDLVQLKLTLEEKVGKKVDVITYDSINPLLRKNILGEQKIIYEKRS